MVLCGKTLSQSGKHENKKMLYTPILVVSQQVSEYAKVILSHRHFSTSFFLDKIMTDALYDFNGTVSIDGRKICNLRFADDICNVFTLV